jgi:L-lactate dehydrogenase complex protein LldG
MNSRDKILARLRNLQPVNIKSPGVLMDRSIYLDYPPDETSLVDTFRRQLTSLQGEVYLAQSKQQAAESLYQIVKDFSGKSSLLQKVPLLSGILAEKSELESVIDDTYPLDSDSISFAEYSCGITTADYLVARTGSIVLNTRSAAGRRLSVLPPVHVIIAEEKQIVASLQQAFTLLREKSVDWSYAVVITGPSRTSDIEKQLVLGAHGPKRLVVIILRS